MTSENSPKSDSVDNVTLNQEYPKHQQQIQEFYQTTENPLEQTKPSTGTLDSAQPHDAESVRLESHITLTSSPMLTSSQDPIPQQVDTVLKRDDLRSHVSRTSRVSNRSSHHRNSHLHHVVNRELIASPKTSYRENAYKASQYNTLSRHSNTSSRRSSMLPQFQVSPYGTVSTLNRRQSVTRRPSIALVQEAPVVVYKLAGTESRPVTEDMKRQFDTFCNQQQYAVSDSPEVKARQAMVAAQWMSFAGLRRAGNVPYTSPNHHKRKNGRSNTVSLTSSTDSSDTSKSSEQLNQFTPPDSVKSHDSIESRHTYHVSRNKESVKDPFDASSVSDEKEEEVKRFNKYAKSQRSKSTDSTKSRGFNESAAPSRGSPNKSRGYIESKRNTKKHPDTSCSEVETKSKRLMVNHTKLTNKRNTELAKLRGFTESSSYSSDMSTDTSFVAELEQQEMEAEEEMMEEMINPREVQMYEVRKLKRKMKILNRIYKILMFALGAGNFLLTLIDNTDNADIPKLYFEIFSVALTFTPWAWQKYLDEFGKEVTGYEIKKPDMLGANPNEIEMGRLPARQ